MGVWKTRTLVGIWRVRTAFMRFWMRRGFLGSVITRKACYILVNKTKLTVYVDLLSASWTFTRDWAFWKYWANSVGGEIPWQLSVRLQPGCFLLPLASFTEKADRNENQSGFGEWAHSSAVNKTCAMGRQQQLLKIVTQKPYTFLCSPYTMVLLGQNRTLKAPCARLQTYWKTSVWNKKAWRETDLSKQGLRGKCSTGTEMTWVYYSCTPRRHNILSC